MWTNGGGKVEERWSKGGGKVEQIIISA